MSMFRCEHLLDIVIMKLICYACEYSTQHPKSRNKYGVNACWKIEPEDSPVGGLQGKSDDEVCVNPLIEAIKAPVCVVQQPPMSLSIFVRAKHVLKQSMRHSE